MTKSAPSLSDYRKNVKTHLVESLLKAGFTKNSETVLQKLSSNGTTLSVTLHDNHYIYLIRERNLREGWSQSRCMYTYQTVKSVLSQSA